METTPEAEINTTSSSTLEDVENVMAQTPLAILVKIVSTLVVIPNFMLNPLMLFTLRRVASIQPTTKIFMASLTLCDICTGLWWLICLVQIFAGAWLLGEFLCAVHVVVTYIVSETTMFSLLLLTIDRYIAISHPLRYPSLVTVRRSKIIVCATCGATIIWCILLHGIYRPPTALQVGPHVLCLGEKLEWRGYVVIILALLVLVIIFSLYVHISLIARRQARRIATENQAGNGQGGQRVPERINTRSTTTIIIITGTLIIAYIPSIIVYKIFTQQIRNATYEYFLIFSLSNAILVSNSWLNVVIYYLRNKDLRKELKSILSNLHHYLFQRALPE